MGDFERVINRLFIIGTLLAFLALAVFGAYKIVHGQDKLKKLPEGQSCSNTFDTDAAHKCDCLANMKCPMKKPEPCYDEEGNCPPPENGPDSTKCISPYCKKDSCKCANPCKS